MNKLNYILLALCLTSCSTYTTTEHHQEIPPPAKVEQFPDDNYVVELSRHTDTVEVISKKRFRSYELAKKYYISLVYANREFPQYLNFTNDSGWITHSNLPIKKIDFVAVDKSIFYSNDEWYYRKEQWENGPFKDRFRTWSYAIELY